MLNTQRRLALLAVFAQSVLTGLAMFAVIRLPGSSALNELVLWPFVSLLLLTFVLLAQGLTISDGKSSFVPVMISSAMGVTVAVTFLVPFAM